MIVEQASATQKSARSLAFRAGDPLLEEIATAALRDLYGYWRERGRGIALPWRADLEPLDIPSLLPIVCLMDVEEGGARFRYRLVGTRIVAWFGSDLTGSYLPEEFAGRYREVVASRRPAYDRLQAPARADHHAFYHRLLMPLGGESGDVEMLLGGLQPLAAPV